MRLVIKGAYYKSGDEILSPIFTGEYVIVDCRRYIKLEELKETFDESYIIDNINDYVTLDDVKYYYAQVSPWFLWIYRV